jgi:hypothetical protein
VGNLTAEDKARSLKGIDAFLELISRPIVGRFSFKRDKSKAI